MYYFSFHVLREPLNYFIFICDAFLLYFVSFFLFYLGHRLCLDDTIMLLFITRCCFYVKNKSNLIIISCWLKYYGYHHSDYLIVKPMTDARETRTKTSHEKLARNRTRCI